MSKFIYVYTDPSISNFTSSSKPTPYGIYDNDKAFVSESIDVSNYVSRKLGHPVMQLEFNSSSIWACFEEAVSDYSQYINNYNAKNWLWNSYGNDNKISGSGWSNTHSSSDDYRMGTGSLQPQKQTLGSVIEISKKYGEAVNVGGDVPLHSGSIVLSQSQQTYDLQTSVISAHQSGRIEVQKVFNEGPAAITRFYDPFAGSYDQRSMLDSFGMGNVSPAVSFILRPIYWDVTRAQAIETNDRIRKSNYSFDIQDNKMRIFPIPTSNDDGNKVWFHYYLRDERNKTTANHLTNKVSDPSNIPYKFITYNEINAAGRQWIRRYTLALAKELLGIIRSKYASMPLPNGEVSMDGDALKAEGREEKANLIEELTAFLESVSLSEKARAEQEQAESEQSVLNKAPLGIYIG